MTLGTFGILSEIVAGIAVLITLVVLIFQVRANTRALKSNTLQSLQAVSNAINFFGWRVRNELRKYA